MLNLALVYAWPLIIRTAIEDNNPIVLNCSAPPSVSRKPRINGTVKERLLFEVVEPIWL